jgi:acyl carrier protein
MNINKSQTIAHEVIKIISKTKALKPSRLRVNSNLYRDLGFDTLDLVDVILEVEKNFKITIPDEVPVTTVGDLVKFVTSHTGRKFTWI